MKSLYRYESVTKETAIFGVIADPVAHSLSPLLHNTAFQSQKIDACYLPFRIPPSDLEQFLEACPKLGIRGLSVTIPHKETVLPYLTQLEVAADGIGAVNTIVFRNGERIGYNTDYRAAMESLAENMDVRLDTDKPFRNKRALVLGTGGVSRALVWGLREKGADVIVAGRSPIKLARFAESMGVKSVAWERRHDVRCEILINGTPLGMHPDVDQTPFDGTHLQHGMVVFETIYNPEQTLLIKNAKQANCKVITGVDMFVRQAQYQYYLFAGQYPPNDLMRYTLKKATSPVKYQYVEDENDPLNEALAELLGDDPTDAVADD